MIPKFRAWHINHAKYYEVSLIDFYTKTVDLIVGYDGELPIINHYSFDKVILEQYIGHKDINEEEIYVDDIIKDEEGNIRKVSLFEVYWRDGISKDWKIIGNIHENKELLD